MCFTDKPIKANYTVVRKFYANPTETNFFGNLVVTVRGKQVHFDPVRINNYYGFPESDNDVHTKRARVVPFMNEIDVSLDRALLIYKVEKHEGDSKRSPEGPIHPRKKKGLGYVNKKRNINEQDPIFGTFTEIQELTQSLPTWPGENSSTSSSAHSIISTLVQDQQILKYMMTKMVRR
ncbi:hypothetical protein KY284_012989 [Solanum tuberosum]|nr:hypothetical protein KY284_012989 [Solanum tuberosum]